MSSASGAWKPKAHAVLTKEQAINIFLEKYISGNFPSQAQKCLALASSYGISSKTVRDIWCGRSWLEVTFDIWGQVDLPMTMINACIAMEYTALLLSTEKEDLTQADLH
jgi:hypothetical protein